MNKIYPAIFHEAEEGGFWVEFPDLEGCFTQGETLEETFKMAREALALSLDGLETLPNASNFNDIQVVDGAKVMLIEAAESDNIEYFNQSQVPQYIESGLTEKGFTKNQIAFILGVDRSYITHIVKGERVPSVDMAKRIAVLLGFDWRIFYANGEPV